MICNHLDRKDVCSNMNEYCSCFYTLEFNIGDVVEMIFIDQGFTFQSNHPSMKTKLKTTTHSYNKNVSISKFVKFICTAFRLPWSAWEN